MSAFPAEHYAAEIGAAEQWRRREPPLAPAAVLAVGDVVAELAAAAHARLAAGAELRAVADQGSLVVLGEPDSLPWADGARYLGWDGRALTLTTHLVLPAADLWRDAAIAQQDADPGSLVVVLPEQILISAMPAQAADPGLLRALADEASLASAVDPNAGVPGTPGAPGTSENSAGAPGTSENRASENQGGRTVPGPRAGVPGTRDETGQSGGMAVRPPTSGGPTWEVLAHLETRSGLAPQAAPETSAGLDRRDTVVDEPA